MHSIIKMKWFGLNFILASLALNVWAGEATLSGYSELEVAPEFVSVTVSVTSECFSSASNVSTANDEIANKVFELLKSVAVSTAGDEVTASGGYVKRYSGYNARRNEPVCVNTFRKENKLTVKTHAVKDFRTMFASLQDKIYELGMSTNINDIEKPTSFVEISVPVAGLTNESKKTFEKKVLIEAIQNAKEKFEATLTLVGIKTYKITNYTELTNVPPRYAADEGRKSIIAEPSAPIEFGNLLVTKSINVRFEYEGDNLDIL